MPKSTFYITTTLPYVNADPHIGFALEIVAADVIARYHALLGKEVIFNTGTDEHGQKILEKALETKQSPQDYVDFYAAKFADLKKLLNLSYSNFIRTTDPAHKQAAQKFWQICQQNGYIYQAEYQSKYCVGCELEKQDSDLVDGHCPLHPKQELEIRNESNYFFKFSKFQQPLLDLYKNHPDFVKPESKYKEIVSFVEGGLKDFSISRLKSKMPWGISVPGDDEQVMYVWFDALVNYISTLGWPENQENFAKFWPGVQICGKDNLRQQAAMWQAMLLAANLPPSAQILVNGFISIDGQKMSKSLGNVIAPAEMVKKYGTDATRFLLMFSGPIGNDIDTSWEKFDEIYTAQLSNGLGNLCSRVAKMCEKAQLGNFKYQQKIKLDNLTLESSGFKHDFKIKIDNFELKEALDWVLSYIADEDKYLSANKPWEKFGEEQKNILQHNVEHILLIAHHLQPFMPKMSAKILAHFSQEKITALAPLFPRINPLS